MAASSAPRRGRRARSAGGDSLPAAAAAREHTCARGAGRFRERSPADFEDVEGWAFGPCNTGTVTWRAGSEADVEVDRHLMVAEGLSPEAQEVLRRMQPLTAQVVLGPYDWHINVRAIPTEGATRVALFMHGHGGSCNLACWIHFWPVAASLGFHLLAFDSPGFGRSSGMTNQTAKWKPYDQDLVLSLLMAMGVPMRGGRVTVFGQCMGGAMFLRAFCKSSDTFAAYHVLHNCTIGTFPSDLGDLLGAKGGGLMVFWEADEDHRRDTNVYRKFSALAAGRPELCRFFDLNGATPRYPAWGAGIRWEGSTRGELSQVPGTGSDVYVLAPTAECLADVACFVARAPRSALALGPTVPAVSALQRGVPSKGLRVFVRVRPLIEREAGLRICTSVAPLAAWEPPATWQGPPPDEIRVRDQSWAFDRVFGPDATQQEVYEAAGRPIVEAVLAGRNGSLMAYGQTGSGKTFTMEGAEGQWLGLTPRVVSDLFAQLLAGSRMTATYVQLYNDQLLDLFEPARPRLGVADNPAYPGGAVVVGATVLEAGSAEELLAHVRHGASFRACGKTNMNDASSRSHAILSLTIPSPTRVLHLVDLAGSERVKRSLAARGRLEEAIAINSSLLALGSVVGALVENDGKPRAHIPYRDSILTRLLRAALGGDAFTALVACVSPAEDSADETANCLRFAAQATFIRNEAPDPRKAEEEAAEAAAAAREASVVEEGAHVPEVDASGEARVPACGVQIACCTGWSAGSAAPVVVFLHHYGFGATGSWWSFLFAAVERAGGRYLAPSMPGHGNTPGASSSKPEDLAKPGGPVEVLKAVLDWLGVRQAILVGYDWGGGIAAEFAILYPRRVKHLALWCMSYRDEARLEKLSKRGKDILFFWEKADLLRSEKKGRALAKALKARFQELDQRLLQRQLETWIRSGG